MGHLMIHMAYMPLYDRAAPTPLIRSNVKDFPPTGPGDAVGVSISSRVS